jgi:hypothetical protein
MEQNTQKDFIFNPLIGERQPLAWAAMVDYLSNGQWYWVKPLISHMMEHSNLQRRSCINLLREAHREGILEKENMFPKKKPLWNRHKMRMVRPLHPWVKPVWDHETTNT